jgi:hypothetical protein
VGEADGSPGGGAGLVSGASVGVGAWGKVGSVVRPDCVAIPDWAGDEGSWPEHGAVAAQAISKATGVHALAVRSIMLPVSPSWGDGVATAPAVPDVPSLRIHRRFGVE